MYTEEEARQRWCPFVRTTLERETTATNRVIGSTVKLGANCEGSLCMAWRWGQKSNPNWHPTNQYTMPYDPRKDEPMFIPDDERGYCGLAGRP